MAGSDIRHGAAVVVAAAVVLMSAAAATAAPDPGVYGRLTGTGPSDERWRPRPGLTWQWQLDGRLDTTVRAKVYDIDGFTTSRSLVRRLHRLGRKVVCYIDAGAWESWRPDADRFPPVVLGKVNPQWPDQRWLDVRRIDVLGPIMVDRLRMCARKRFDGVELDEVDGYSNDTGFPLRARHQLRYNRFLARQTRRLGLAAGLKNDLEQVGALVERFDFAVNEQCFQYRECRSLRPFIRARKAVFHVEYHVPRHRFCPTTTRLGFSSMKKHLDLRRWRRPCPSRG
ncbi:MAG TPA: endo alpha-1,4 polygalactosaminidase [Gaiellaceae bacterium]|nr:endo alpha-1,4 polygalactosaminidase [Gaiellaceae bacterium]